MEDPTRGSVDDQPCSGRHSSSGESKSDNHVSFLHMCEYFECREMLIMLPLTSFEFRTTSCEDSGYAEGSVECPTIYFHTACQLMAAASWMCCPT